MHKLSNLTFYLVFILTLVNCNKTTQNNKAIFNYFEYEGKDKRFERNINPQSEYFNPIVAGFYPDPSICRKGDDYYMVHSSFSYYPGVPIFHSKDLVNWKQIGHILNRPSQLQLDGIRLSGGIYAPAIEYNKYNETFYMITTCVDGIGNFVVKTKDPMLNNWSEPIPLPHVGGIDPSLFFDDDGKAYIVHNDAPEGTPEWDGHRAIWIHNYDIEKDITFGERKVLLDGGVDRSTKPVWIEGPHIYKINNKYYLMAAEGGTSINHSEVILRANDVMGPYIPYENNPILTQRGLQDNRPDIVTSVGHADLIDTPEGDWYAIFLGCRPYKGNHYNTGRETFLLPVKWENEFPIILEDGLPIPTVVTKHNLDVKENFLTGNFVWRDNFQSNSLANEWLFIRTPKGQWWSSDKNRLAIEGIDKSIYDIDNPAFIGRRQQHLCFRVETQLTFSPKNNNEIAGLVCYQNETHNIVFGKTFNKGNAILVVDRSEKQRKRIAEIAIPKNKENNPITLKIEGENDKYNFQASFDEGLTWQIIIEEVDAKNLSTESAGGFTGITLGMYASKCHQN
ncbi:MAG: glycoside hydrolase family 43 protein [Bacteroidales bacterium]|nr:glycoside hydrolase family 43 protein [Bacteroidales bacterium]